MLTLVEYTAKGSGNWEWYVSSNERLWRIEGCPPTYLPNHAWCGQPQQQSTSELQQQTRWLKFSVCIVDLCLRSRLHDPQRIHTRHTSSCGCHPGRSHQYLSTVHVHTAHTVDTQYSAFSVLRRACCMKCRCLAISRPSRNNSLSVTG